MIEGVLVPMKVWRPDESVITVVWIAGAEDHYGNLVAENRLSKEEYWPRLYRDARADESRVRGLYLTLRDEVEKCAYRRAWETLYLDYMQS
jgi:hypothetical protein